MPAVQVKNLNVYAAKRALVHNVSFDILQGQTLALMGASGSGKSLTAMALMDILPPSLHHKAEQVNFMGARPALIMQNPGDCFDQLFNVEQNFLETLPLARADALKQMHKLLEEVGLDAHTAKRYPFELSGGMLHKVMIALAIAQVQHAKASCIIADEPIAGLDCTSKTLLLQHLKMLQRKYNFALLYIDHDLTSARLMADHLAIMQDGKIVEYGKVSNILQNPKHQYTKELIATFQSTSTITPCNERPHTSPCILSCTGLEKNYPKAMQPALKNINFDLMRGENLGIVGHNGAGKSTLLQIILDLEQADKGSVHILGQDIKILRKNRSWRKHIQAVFQHARLAINPRMTVHNILMEPLRAHGFQGDEAAEVTKLLNLVQLSTHYAKAYPGHMSGGQLQRLCIARALALKPDILLLDEPLTDLDAVVAEGILSMLNDLKNTLNITILYISHDIRSVLRLCERILVLHQGHLVDNFKACEYQSPERHAAFHAFIQHSHMEYTE